MAIYSFSPVSMQGTTMHKQGLATVPFLFVIRIHLAINTAKVCVTASSLVHVIGLPVKLALHQLWLSIKLGGLMKKSS